MRITPSQRLPFALVVLTATLGPVPGHAYPPPPEVLQEVERLSKEVAELDKQGKHRQALPILDRLLAIVRKESGPLHYDTACVLSARAGFHFHTLDLTAAEKDLGDALAVLDSPDLVGGPGQRKELLLERGTLRGRLGEVLEKKGDRPQAVAQVRKGLDAFTEAGARDSADGAILLNNLGLWLAVLGDDQEGLPLLLEAVLLRERLNPVDERELAVARHNVAVVYNGTGDPKAALPYARKAADQMQKLWQADPATHWLTYAATAADRGRVYYRLGRAAEAAIDLAAAEATLRKGLEDARQGRNRWNEAGAAEKLAAVLSDRGCILADRGRPDEALSNFDEAIRLQREWGTRGDPTEAERNRAVVLAFHKGRPAEAAPALRDLLVARAGSLDYYFSHQSERQRLAFLGQQRLLLDTYLSVGLAAGIPPSELYGHVLAWKGAVFGRQRADHPGLQEPALVRLVGELREAAGRVVLWGRTSVAPADEAAWVKTLGDLRRRKEDLERRLQEALARPVAAGGLGGPGPDDVAARLPHPDHAALIDYLTFARYAWDREKGTLDVQPGLLAFVVRGGEPRIDCIDLGDVRPVLGDVRRWCVGLRGPLAADRTELDQIAARVSSRVWDPVRARLDEKWPGRKAHLVVVSPDGPLCAFPFAALPGDGPGRYLLHERLVATVLSGRHAYEAFSPGRPTAPTPSLLVAANVDYGPAADHPKSFQAIDPDRHLIAQAAGPFAARFPAARCDTLEGGKADRPGLLRALGKKYANVVLVTHGEAEADDWFRVDAGQARLGGRVRCRPQGLLGGRLVLAGANNPRPALDSLLSYEDLSTLALGDTDLMVCWVCGFGAGEPSSGEGLRSLARAAHVAGVRTLVAPLAAAAEGTTAHLSELFQENLWRHGQGKLVALRNAQLEVRQHSDHPSDWAIWTLSGDIGSVDLSVDPAVPGPSGPQAAASDWRGWVGVPLAAALLVVVVLLGRRLCIRGRDRSRQGAGRSRGA